MHYKVLYVINWISNFSNSFSFYPLSKVLRKPYFSPPWQIHLFSDATLTTEKDCNAQKIKFSIKDFFIKCVKIYNFLRILSHLLKKSLMESISFRAVIKVTQWLRKMPSKSKVNQISFGKHANTISISLK